MKLVKIKQDFQGKWVEDTPRMVVNLTPRNYSMQDYFVRSAQNDGSLRIEVWRGTLKGMWRTMDDVTSIKMI